MSDAATNFLGSGFAFPFRTGAAGLPDVKFVTGRPLVAGVVNFLLNTMPGDLRWAPGIGADLEAFRQKPVNRTTEEDAIRALEQSLGASEPRLADVRVTSERRAPEERIDLATRFVLITAPTAASDVRLPRRGQQDILRQFPSGALAIQGFADAISIISGVGQTGNE